MPDAKRPLKVFLCHAHDDKSKARELYRYLKRRGIQPWLDAEDLLPGQAWQVEIPKALETSDAIIILLSQTSVDKEGYVQKEIKFALDKALEMPEGRIFIIPARLDACNVPRSLSGYHWVDLFEESGYEKLIKSLKARSEQINCLDIILKDVSEFSVIAAIPKTSVIPSSSIRLKQVLELINNAKNTQEIITVPRIAQLLGFSVTHEVEACFEGKAEASVSFLEKFADFFGTNKQWLQFGEGNPFETEEKMQMQPLDYFERIRVLEPNEIIFVRESLGYGRTVILLYISEYKSIYFPSEFHISSQIGGTGRYQLLGLHKLMTKIEDEGFPYSSRQIPKKDFDKLVDGKIFPAQIVNFPPSYWAADFLSPDFDKNGAAQYDIELWKAYKIIEKDIKPAVQPVSTKRTENKSSINEPKREPKVEIPYHNLKPSHSQSKRVYPFPPPPPPLPLFYTNSEMHQDIIGIFIGCFGWLIAVTLLLPGHGSISAAILYILDFLFGFGTYLLPFILFGIGIWIIIRKIEGIPPVSTERIIGIVVLFLLIQTIIQGFTTYGGWVGNIFYTPLYKNLGTGGTVMVMIVWGILGLSLVYKISVTELLSKFNFIQKSLKKIKKH